ncbi:MAG: hypothetical protein QXU32_06760 [Nitrososphaerales archaeon]
MILKTDEYIGSISTQTGVVAVEAVVGKNKVYVAEFESGGISIYNLDTKKFAKNIALPVSELTFWRSPEYGWADQPIALLSGGVSMDYNPVNDMLYVANYSHWTNS